MQRVAQEGPRLSVDAVPLDARPYESRLESGEADLALGAFPKAALGLRRQRLYPTSYLALARRDHPNLTALRTRVGFLAARHIVVTASNTGHAAHRVAQQSMDLELPAANVMLRLPSFTAAAVVTSQTDGVTTLPMKLARIMAEQLEAITTHGVTTICAPPTVWRMVIQEDLRQWKTSLREVCSAGEPLNPEVIEQVRAAWGLTIRDGYGQTETTLQIGNPPGLAIKLGSMGKPMPGYRFELATSDGRNVEEGEISIPLDKAPVGIMRGYQSDDGAIVPLGGQSYRTGDVATRDDDGYFTYVGRADDVFKASDYRISPFELESAMIEHEAVAEAAIVPAPDAVRTAVPKAFIALAPGFEPTRDIALSIFRHSRRRLASYKRVRRIELYELPKTISGKIRRVELRQREMHAFTDGVSPSGEFREEDFEEFR